MKFSIKDFFSKCDQIRNFLWILSHLLKKSLMENFIFLCSDISNFISSPSQVFGRIDVLQKLHNIQRKTSELEYILIKLQASNFQSETLIRKETPAKVFSCEFCKKFRTPFYETALRDCFCNFNIAKVGFSICCALLTNFRYFSKSLPN